MKVPDDTVSNVMIFDRDPEVIDLLYRLLSKNGFQVTTETDWHRAIELGRTNRFAVVLAECNLQDLDGLFLLKSIAEKNPTIQVILMTGATLPERVMSAYTLGVSGYLFKPFTNLNEVLHTVHMAVYRYQRWISALRRAQSQNESVSGAV
ncbi:MAG: response regulator [Myxococcales bacterium]|nr:response regulator [Myxococcales bacterium]